MGQVAGHYLIVFFVAPLREAPPPLQLQKEETDAAVWFPLSGDGLQDEKGLTLTHADEDVTSNNTMPLLEQLTSRYPIENSTVPMGCGEAHLFALGLLRGHSE